MPQIIIGNRGLTLSGLISLLQNCDPSKTLWVGPGYLAPTKEWNPRRFDYMIQLEFGCTDWDHNKDLRPKKKDLVPEITVGEYLEWLGTIPGQRRELWKGGDYVAALDSEVCVGLFGEVPMDVVGVHEGRYGDVTLVLVRL